jgi:putative Holliday junction resolvase
MSAEGARRPSTVLGFDFGERRIGVAVGQTITRSATPLAIIVVRDGQPDWAALSQMVREYEPQLFLVGIPTHENGSPHALAARVERFCRQLHERYRLPVETIDEHLSSVEAEARADTHAAPVDALAAQVILETWFNENRGAKEVDR